jgi:hypothetical protein
MAEMTHSGAKDVGIVVAGHRGLTGSTPSSCRVSGDIGTRGDGGGLTRSGSP